MADSVRQKIVDAVKARMQTILTSGGYETNLGSNVTVWGTNDNQDHELPNLDIRDTKWTGVERPLGGVHEGTLEFELEFSLKDGTSSGNTGRKAIADIWKAIGVDVRFTSSSVKLTHPARAISDELYVEQKGKTVAQGLVKFSVQYQTLAFDPYNQP